MTFKTVIDSPCGLRFCFEKLNTQSGFSRRYLLEKEMMSSKEDILSVYDNIEKYRTVLGKTENRIPLQTLQFKLQGLKDIEQTIKKLKCERVLDDIELFEIKHIALLSIDVAHILADLKISNALDPSAGEVVDILDPDHLKIASFYIYDSYSPELSSLRISIRDIDEGDERQELMAQAYELESVIRRDIAISLCPYAGLLEETLHELAEIDIYAAKAIMTDTYGMTFPSVSEKGYMMKGLFNPEVKNALSEYGKEFQNIDISYGGAPTLIIGANMGGKTVVLKTLALCQYLFQFGFPIPAQKAEMEVKNGIFLVCGDGQSEIKGLSSFASEIKKIDEVIRSASAGDDILALIDEPARSTNPIEGTALVSALITILSGKKKTLVLTTHYNIEASHCRRLKVKGLENGTMDYRLTESNDSDVPHEALNVAESLNISKEWIKEAKNILKTNLKK